MGEGRGRRGRRGGGRNAIRSLGGGYDDNADMFVEAP